MAGYKISNAAKQDLIRIHHFGIKRFGVNQADKYFESFFEYFEIISQKPHTDWSNYLMKKSFIFFLFCLLISFPALSQKPEDYLATLNGFCSGKLTIQDLLENPEVVVKSESSSFKIIEVALFSNSTGVLYEFRNNKPQLSDKMIEHISSLKQGDEIYFDVKIKVHENEFLLNPLFFEVAKTKENTFKCSSKYRATVSHEVHGKISKSELLNEGKISVVPNESLVKLKSFTLYTIIDGRPSRTFCTSADFNETVRSKIEATKKFQRVYFSNIFAICDGKYMQLNPIEIQID